RYCASSNRSSRPILHFSNQPMAAGIIALLRRRSRGSNESGLHASNAPVGEFARIVIDAVNRGGKILVPTFAVGRAQLITLLLAKMFRAGKVKPFPIFLDSPMAVEATNIYAKHTELFDEEMKAFIRDRPLRVDLKTMKPTPTADESRAINDVRGAWRVMAGA